MAELKIEFCPNCCVCALCDAPGADRMIARAVEAEANTHPPCEFPGVGVISEIATVHAKHFPAAFRTLADRHKRMAITRLWSQIDAVRGYRAPLDRRPLVRTPLADPPATLGDRVVAELLTPRSSLVVRFCTWWRTAVVRRSVSAAPHEGPPMKAPAT